MDLELGKMDGMVASWPNQVQIYGPGGTVDSTRGILGYFWSASTLCRKKMRQIQRVIAPTSVDEFDNCS